MKHTDEELQRLLRSYLDPDDEHPDLDEVLFRYTDGTLRPSGAIIETQHAEFRWPAVKNATYKVRIFEKEKEIASGPALHDDRWTIAESLTRGETYVWQVEARGSRGITILPAPPDP